MTELDSRRLGAECRRGVAGHDLVQRACKAARLSTCLVKYPVAVPRTKLSPQAWKTYWCAARLVMNVNQPTRMLHQPAYQKAASQGQILSYFLSGAGTIRRGVSKETLAGNLI
jgi:hypothetical protein